MAPVHVSPNKTSGTKRSAVDEAASSDAACGAATDRPERQRPRLEPSSEEHCFKKHKSSHAHEAEVRLVGGHIGDIDIMSHIACFVDTGKDLMSICVSVGRRDAAKIRKKYLRKNDAYLVKLLRRLGAIEKTGDGLYTFRENLHTFDKCRDCVNSWMEVNKNWKERCTIDKMEAYSRQVLSLPYEADVIFNNPVVAIEIGLLDVVQFLVEERGIYVNGLFWRSLPGLNIHTGYYKPAIYNNPPLILVAMFRGDVVLLHYLLSVDEFDLKP